MRRCTSCFRFQPGHPTYCAHCGRTFDVRICPRGHRNPRHVQYCTQCGSADLSTPSPPASLGFRLTGALLYGFMITAVLLISVSAAAAALHLVDWSRLSGPLTELAVVVGLLYWTTTLLPGPVKKIGRSAARRLTDTIRKEQKR